MFHYCINILFTWMEYLSPNHLDFNQKLLEFNRKLKYLNRVFVKLVQSV